MGPFALAVVDFANSLQNALFVVGQNLLTYSTALAENIHFYYFFHGPRLPAFMGCLFCFVLF